MARQDQGLIDQHQDALFADGRDPILGNPQGNKVLVLFFDYNCGYCRKAKPEIEALLADDPELKLILKNLPILGEGSRAAARWLLAVADAFPDRTAEFHERLLGRDGPADGAAARDVVRAMGLPAETLAERAADPAQEARLARSQELARVLGLAGTPAFIGRARILPGAAAKDELAELLAPAAPPPAAATAPRPAEPRAD